MFEQLGRAPLKTGETLDIRVVEPPDASGRDTVLKLLSHKSELSQWQFEQEFSGRCTGLRTRYYLGFIEGTAVANIALWESGPAGDLGHVYTVESQRRKGICKALMTVQMEDFRRRGGRFLVLGTGYDTAPYHIYRRFGFEPMQPGSGSMHYRRDAAFFDEYFAPGPVEYGTLEWRDWGWVCALMALPGGDWLRSKGERKFGPACYEGALKRDLYGLQQGVLQARVARAPSGAAAGYAVLRPDAAWNGRSRLLDLFIHPDFAGAAAGLLQGFDWPEECVLCYLDAASPAREGTMAAGFVEVGRLGGVLRRPDGDPVEIVAMRRE